MPIREKKTLVDVFVTVVLGNGNRSANFLTQLTAALESSQPGELPLQSLLLRHQLEVSSGQQR